MFVKDIMTKNVVTVRSNTSITEARKIMKEHNFRRLPVVDKGKLVGIVTEDRLERISPKTTTPLIWQLAYLASRTTLKDVMRKKVITIKPEATVEEAVDLAQRNKVGQLIVVEEGKIIGVVTTNDFFYNIVNPILGIGESGSRIIVPGGGDGKAAEKIIICINKTGIGIKLVWTLRSSEAGKKDIIVQLDTEDATGVIEKLKQIGYSASLRAR